MIAKGDRRVISGWVMYDWANSVYSLVITSTIFPIFFQNITTTKNSFGDIVSENVNFLGMELNNSALYSYTISFSFLLVAAITPLLSGIADYSDNKKRFMQFFCYLGSASCIGLFFFDPDHLLAGLILVVLASIGFSGSLVFYNAYLPEIAPEEEQDKISARGYAMGYIGSIILLICNLCMIMSPSTFGIKDDWLPAKISFLMVGIWWAGFAQISFARLPRKSFNISVQGRYLTKGYLELVKVFSELRENLRIRRYLLAFFVYNTAVQTIMLMAVTFAKDEITDMPDSGLIVSILIIQIIAVGGAYFFSFLSALVGNIRCLIYILLIWIAICIIAFFTYTAIEFYILASLVGFVMGGIQSLSRSTYSKILPETIDHTSYFSFYDVCDKVGTVIGTFIYGIMIVLTSSSRNSIIALAMLFIIGFFLLRMVPELRNRKSAS